MDMSSHGMGTVDQTPPSALPVPQKMRGIGNGHMEITATAEAQMWFNQGLNLLHDFWDYESARAFEQSVRVDPQCAICYWGLYKAESCFHSTSKGYVASALTKAVSLKAHTGERERLYIEASANHENGLKQEVEIWRTIVRKYPTDIQAKIFLAGLVDSKEKLEILEALVKSYPDDSAANHCYIHAVEGSEHPEQALHSAEIPGRLALVGDTWCICRGTSFSGWATTLVRKRFSRRQCK
jgi:hypothetical protein